MEPVMRSPSSDSARPDDTDPNQPSRRRAGRHADRGPLRRDDTAPGEPPHHPRPQSFGQRHALKIMGVVMALMFATVIIAQVAC
jgi:hypothetical protein